MTVAPDRFVDIMASLASGVAIVTTVDADGEPRGLTTTAIVSVSADPPLLLICVAHASRTLAALRRSRRFVVNLVKDGRAELCRRFASRDADKFAGLRWRSQDDDLPILHDDALAWATCQLVEEIPAGDHTIILARVDGGRGCDPGDRPLTYYHRRWGTWQPLD